MSERNDFEKWWKDTWGTEGTRTLARNGGDYTGTLARWAWVAWNERASRPTARKESE